MPKQRKVLKRSNPLALNDYKRRIKNHHNNGKLFLAWETWINYRWAGGRSTIYTITGVKSGSIDYKYYKTKERGIK